MPFVKIRKSKTKTVEKRTENLNQGNIPIWKHENLLKMWVGVEFLIFKVMFAEYMRDERFKRFIGDIAEEKIQEIKETEEAVYTLNEENQEDKTKWYIS